MPAGDDWGMFGIFDPDYELHEREIRRRAREDERLAIIRNVMQTLQNEFNNLIMNLLSHRELADRISSLVRDAEHRLLSLGVRDVEVSVAHHPASARHLIVRFTDRGSLGQQHLGDITIPSSDTSVAPMRMEFRGEGTPRHIISAAAPVGELTTIRQNEPPVAEFDEATTLGRTMADAYAQRLRELGLGAHVGQSTQPAFPPTEKDTTDNFTPKRKLEID